MRRLAVAVLVAMLGATLIDLPVKGYDADEMVYIFFKLDDSIIKPKMIPGGRFDLDVYVHNNNSNPAKGVAIGAFQYNGKDMAMYKIDWQDEWKYADYMVETVIWGNRTENVFDIDVEIPKDASIGEHKITVKIFFYRYGDGWGTEEGSDVGWVWANYTFTVNPASGGGSGGSSGSTDTGNAMLFAVVGIVVLVVAVALVVVLRRR